MGIHGYGYNQICVCIHIIMGSQILIYYTRLTTRLVPVTNFTHWYPRAWVFLSPLFLFNLKNKLLVIRLFNQQKKLIRKNK